LFCAFDDNIHSQVAECEEQHPE
jgi:hypothetical protein